MGGRPRWREVAPSWSPRWDRSARTGTGPPPAARPRALRAIATRLIELASATAIVTFVSGCGTSDSPRASPASAASASSGSAGPLRGGTLILIGATDVDHLTTTSAYIGVSLMLLRATSRQIVAYPADSNFARENEVIPDLATELPSAQNGGVSTDGTRYTFHLRHGVRWNTRPPRDVTAKDAELGMQLLCNPVSPVSVPAYYVGTILGMKPFCDAFGKIPGTVADIKRFVSTHEISGVHAPDDSTLVVSLLQPAPDFLHVMAMLFAAPVPAEYLDYVPDSPELRKHTLSNGPYEITSYIPNREITLHRNPVWDSASDPLRKAYVDSMRVLEGVNAQSVQQQLQAGTADLMWGGEIPAADRPALVGAHDPNLLILPSGEAYIDAVYTAVNLLSPNNGSALKKLEVRQAIGIAIDRAAITQAYGGPSFSRPLYQAVSSAAAGFRPGFDAFPGAGQHGDPAKARALLAKAGYPNGLTLTLLYHTDGVEPQAAQTIQASLAKAGITITLLPARLSDFFAKYVEQPDNARRGVWDLALADWIPDWFGSNDGRSVIEPLFDGRTFGANTVDFGDYDDSVTNRFIDQARTASSVADAERGWTGAATRVAEDAGIIPLTENKVATYHSSRAHGCVIALLVFRCDLSSIWLSDADPRLRK